MNSRFFHIHGMAITLIIFLFIGLVKLVTFRSHYFDPFNNGMKDYEVTDIIYSQLRDKSRVQRETRIALVHVEKPTRTELAAMLERIAAFSPAVIGLDILFQGEKDSLGDAQLRRVLHSIPNVVLAANLAPYVDSLKGIPNMIVADSAFSNHSTSAYTNFLAGADKTVRMFTPQLNTLDGQEHLAFGVALSGYYDSLAVRKLLRRNNPAERIDYFGEYRSFLRKNGSDIAEASDEELSVLFRDRIVMIGFADSRDSDAPIEDRYFTPLNPVYTGRSIPDMYGMVIHANIVSMILDGRYIYELPTWIRTLLVVAFAYFNVQVIHRIYHWLPDTFHGITRIMQLIELLIFFFIVAFLFNEFRVKIDFSTGFLALILAYDVVMIYESLIRKRIPFLKNVDYED
jgi:CHASE2 domain-containing sensor protein